MGSVLLWPDLSAVAHLQCSLDWGRPPSTWVWAAIGHTAATRAYSPGIAERFRRPMKPEVFGLSGVRVREPVVRRLATGTFIPTCRWTRRPPTGATSKWIPVEPLDASRS